MAYDAAKAAEYNQLIQQGLSPAAAASQAGISENDYDYQINEVGTPATNPNYGKLESAGLNQPDRRGNTLVSSESDPELPTPQTTGSSRVTTYSSYTSTSTETVSGGGSTTVVANRTVPTASSEIYAAQANAKQAEVDAFIKDNPSNFARKKQGLPPLSPDEALARQAQLDTLNDQRAQLYNTSLDARDNTAPTISSVPNTTTTTQTLTTGVAVSRELVDYNNDAFQSQQTELRLETTTTRVNSQSATDTDGNSAGYGSSYETDEFGTPLVSAQESVFDPRQDVGENVFDPGQTYNGPATEESVFDPRQDVGESVFDPASAVPRADITDAAARINDPYYGLTSEQLKALGGADPTDPYIRARLGIPQLSGSTLNPGGFAALQPTGVPLIDGALSAISSFASSLSSFFGVTTKPAVTATGTTTGAPSSTGIDTQAIAKDATAVKEQNPDLNAAAKQNLTNIQEASVNTAKAEEYIDINNRNIQANEQSQAQALEQQRQAQEIIDQNNAELADDNLSDSRREELLANNAAQRASIAENAAVIDEAQNNIEQATANNEQQVNSILENQYVADQNAEAYRSNTTGGVDENGDPVNTIAEDPEFNDYGAPEYDAATDGPLTATGTQELTAEETAALLDEAEATIEPPPTARPGEPGGAPLLTDAELATIYGVTDPQEVGAIQGTRILDDDTRAALSDPETIKRQEALNQEAAENPAIIPNVVLEDDPSLTIPEGDETGPPTTDEAVNAEEDPEIAAADAAVAAPLEATSDVTIPEDVDPNVDAELEEPPGTEGEITELAEPVDPESDPELLAGEEEEPFTELAEPPDPDATPELEQLAGEEDLEPYTELAEPPTDEPEQLGDPELEDGEITDLAEPVDPDADPELEQLGDPALQEEADTEAEQLSGPTDVDTAEDQGLNPGGLSDEELLARQNPGGLSDEEILARQQAAEQSKAKADAINQATLQSRYKQPGNTDWRVRLSLAPSSFYLYNVLGSGDQGAGILAPLVQSNGVIFPYMPQISTMYRANYEQYDLVHSNFRGVYYKSSRVDDIQIRGTFTAQDTTEAAYLLATIHFFRSVTKMFYGKDVERGTPPPLVYLSGLGDYQFSKHPCLVSQFSYTLPNDVDYIRATNPNDYGGNLLNRRTPTQVAPGGINFAGARRLANALTPSGQPLPKGATPQTPQNNSIVGRVNNTGDFSTYVPTMMEIDITLVPVQTRSQVSKQFSLKDFANGNLLRKGFW
jgi:hypothetical protein